MNAPIPSLKPRARGVARLGTAALALVSTLLTLLGFPAHAEILFGERFTYPDGPVSETAAPFWRNLTGTPGQIRVANGTLRPAEGEAEIVETLFNGGPYSDATLYASFTLTVTAPPSGTGDYFAAFSAAEGPRTVGRIFVTSEGAAPGTYRLGVSTAIHFPLASFPDELQLNTAYRVLIRLVVSPGERPFATTLWLNPVSEAEGGLRAPDHTPVPGAIAGFAFRQRLTDGNGMGAVTVDNLVVATTFDEAKAGPPPDPQWTYTTTAGAVTITGYNGERRYVRVPERINGQPVTRIAAGAFRDKTGLRTMTLPSGLIQIGSQAFMDSGVTGIFVPDGVTSIQAETFVRCKNLTRVSLPPTLRSIASMAFAWTGLTEISIPRTVTTFDSSALMFCTNLPAIQVEAENPGFATVDGVLFNKSLTTLRIYPAGRPGNYQIPGSVSRIEQTAFSGAIHPRTLVIPDTVTSLGIAAFQGCTGLTTVRIGRGLPTLTANAFSSCTSLAEVILPDTLRTISAGAFFECPSLHRLTIPASVRTFQGAGIFDRLFLGTDRLDLYFEGNAPSAGSQALMLQPFGSGPTIYYRPGTTGWRETFAGRPTVLWDPQVATGDGAPGFRDGKFGFTLTGASGMSVAVEACTDLANPVWVRLGTHRLTDGASPFVDADSANHPGRFYRFQFP